MTRAFYLQDAELIAPKLLGKRLVHETPEGITAGMIVEVEAYIGPEDKGAHSYMGRRTSRTEIQFGPGGFAYIFSIYGMHCCFNVVTNAVEKPDVVLVRALEPIEGIEIMKERRRCENVISLCNGPGKLCEALDITKAQYGADLCTSHLYLEEYKNITAEQIMVSPRINIDYAEEYKDRLWRYYIKDNPCVSVIPRKYRDKCRSYLQ